MPIFLFDLDNTLYDANRHCFPHMHAFIHDYLMRRLGLDETGASALRQHYWRRYGTTLAGLMRHHAVDPVEFLESIHPPALAATVPPDRSLRQWLRHLPGPAFVFTNSVASHARRVLARLGVEDQFAGIFDMHFADYRGKPDAQVYRRILRALRVPSWRCIFFDDSRANLRTARWLGMHTVHISHRRHPVKGALQLASPAQWRRPLEGFGRDRRTATVRSR
ncbi:MAG: pyrimidine 5'-nucleotidase [Acidithiobacillus sp.]|uniref:pyrimidine 5'-nucleotidase n=1 Tax=Acidithiobacillus sp. TaxID=1872118 RepID=UPI003D06E18E